MHVTTSKRVEIVFLSVACAKNLSYKNSEIVLITSVTILLLFLCFFFRYSELPKLKHNDILSFLQLIFEYLERKTNKTLIGKASCSTWLNSKLCLVKLTTRYFELVKRSKSRTEFQRLRNKLHYHQSKISFTFLRIYS